MIAEHEPHRLCETFVETPEHPQQSLSIRDIPTDDEAGLDLGFNLRKKGVKLRLIQHIQVWVCDPSERGSHFPPECSKTTGRDHREKRPTSARWLALSL